MGFVHWAGQIELSFFNHPVGLKQAKVLVSFAEAIKDLLNKLIVQYNNFFLYICYLAKSLRTC